MIIIGDLPGGGLQTMQQALAEVEAADLDEPNIGPVVISTLLEAGKGQGTENQGKDTENDCQRSE